MVTLAARDRAHTGTRAPHSRLPTPGSVTDGLRRLLLTGLKSCLLFAAWILPENVFRVPNQHTTGKMRNTAHSVLETSSSVYGLSVLAGRQGWGMDGGVGGVRIREAMSPLD